MRLFIGFLTVAFATAFVSVTSAKAQYCAPTVCANPWQDKAVRAKPKKVTAKKQKKPAKEQYMRVAP